MALERLNSQQFDQFRDLIYENSGIRMDKNKVSLLSNRIRRRVNAGGFDDFDAYYRFLTSPEGTGEIDGFLDAVTTNETYFFRTEKQFDWFKKDWLGEQISQQRAGQRKAELRIWSAGCADGAEPYTIAICLAENSYRLRDWSLKIVGTDISNEMLDIARAGTFKPRSLEAITERQRRRFFQSQSESDRWQVRPSIKQLVEFKHHNLMEPVSERQFDCIFIRNVLIYFDAQSKRTVINNLRKALVVGGYLVVGPSEGVYELLHDMRRVSPLIYQKVDELSVGIEPSRRGAQQ